MSFTLIVWILAIVLFPVAFVAFYIINVWSFPRRVASLIKTNQKNIYSVTIKCSNSARSELSKTRGYRIEVSEDKKGLNRLVMRGPSVDLVTVRWQRDKIQDLCDSFRLDQ